MLGVWESLSLAAVSSILIVAGVLILMMTGNWLPGATAFAICLGLGSGINSIAQGSLPLYLFGSEGIRSDYGQDGGRATGGECRSAIRLCCGDGKFRDKLCSHRQCLPRGNRYRCIRCGGGILENACHSNELKRQIDFSETRFSSSSACSLRSL